RPPGAVQVRGPVHADRGPAHADRGSRGHLCGDIHRLYRNRGHSFAYKAQHGRKVQTLNTFNTLLRGNHMANSTRMGRINDDIQLALSSLLRQVKDPRVQQGLISVTRVETTGDLRYAK